MTNIIAFSGGMGVGKSTAIRVLTSVAPGHVRLVKFAGPLYDMQELIYARIASVYQRPETFVKDRKLLQWLGTDWGRSLSESLWVDLWQTSAKDVLERPNHIVVCDDCRFDNEADAIHALGGIVINIKRPDAHSHAEGGVGIKAHASENGLSANKIDHQVSNDGSLSDYTATLTELFNKLAVVERKEK
jgi:hypothetical protein